MEKRKFKPEMLLTLALPIVLSLLATSGGPSGVRHTGSIGQFEIYLATSILTALMAFFLFWQKSVIAIASALIIPVVYSVLILQFTLEKVPIFQLFLPMLIFAILILVLLKYVFYNQLFLRLRTILFSIFAGLAMTLYFWLQYFMMKVPLESGFWMNRFVNSLLLFIFIALGLSFADMIIVRREIAELKAIRRAAILNDEIEDEDGNDL